MNKKLKQFFGILLVITMIITIIPISNLTVFALDYYGTGQQFLVGQTYDFTGHQHEKFYLVVKDGSITVGSLPNESAYTIEEPVLETFTDSQGRELYYWTFSGLGVSIQGNPDQTPTGIEVGLIPDSDNNSPYKNARELRLVGNDAPYMGHVYALATSPSLTVYLNRECYPGDHIECEIPRLGNNGKYLTSVWGYNVFNGTNRITDQKYAHDNSNAYTPYLNFTMPNENGSYTTNDITHENYYFINIMLYPQYTSTDPLGYYTINDGKMYEYNNNTSEINYNREECYVINKYCALVADDAPAGKEFDHWDCDQTDIVLDDATSPVTFFYATAREYGVNDDITFTAVYRDIPGNTPNIPTNNNNNNSSNNNSSTSSSNNNKPTVVTAETFKLPEIDFNDPYWFDPYDKMYEDALKAGDKLVEFQGDFGLPAWFMEKIKKNDITVHYTVCYISQRYKDYHKSDKNNYTIYDIYITPENVTIVDGVTWYGPEFLGIFYHGTIIDQGDKPFEKKQTAIFNTMG